MRLIKPVILEGFVHKNALFIHSNVICVMQIMSALLPDTYTNALVNTAILLSVNTLKHNMIIKEQRSITSLKS